VTSHEEEHQADDLQGPRWMPPLHGIVLPRVYVGGDELTHEDSPVSRDLWISMENLVDSLDLTYFPVRGPRAWSLHPRTS
jgi:hypothetical protein